MTEVIWNTFDRIALRPGAVSIDDALEAAKTSPPRSILAGAIDLKPTPGSRLSGVLSYNISTVFIKRTTDRKPNAGPEAELTTFVSVDPLIDAQLIRTGARPDKTSTVLVFNYQSKTSVTAEELVNILNGVDGIDAELLPGADPARVFTSDELIGFQGTFNQFDDTATGDDFLTLQDLGWTRMPVCPGTVTRWSATLDRPKPGHSCFYLGGGDNPDGDINASVDQSRAKWWMAGAARRLGLANRPTGRSDNREYISWEIDTTTAPANRFGRISSGSKGRGDENYDTYINISTREGDFVGAVSANTTTLRWTMPNTRYANDQNWVEAAGTYVLQPNTRYYINIVHCRSGLGTPLPSLGEEITSNTLVEPYPFDDPVDKDIIISSYFDADFEDTISTQRITPSSQSTSPIDYASRPSLSELGWRRRKTCLLVGATGYNLWHQGHESFYFMGGDNPNGDPRAGLYPGNLEWWNKTGLTRRIVFVGGFGANPSQDNRQYISLEIDTTGMPTTQTGRFIFNDSQVARQPTRVIWSFSEREGDFDPFQPRGGYGVASFINQIRWAGQDYVETSRGGYGNLLYIGQRHFVMKPNTKYYFNMVATESPLGTPPERLQPIRTVPDSPNDDPRFTYLNNTRMLLFVPYG